MEVSISCRVMDTAMVTVMAMVMATDMVMDMEIGMDKIPEREYNSNSLV